MDPTGEIAVEKPGCITPHCTSQEAAANFEHAHAHTVSKATASTVIATGNLRQEGRLMADHGGLYPL
jgi:hypothetical protein